MPKGFVTMEKLFDLQNHFRAPPFSKTRISTPSHEQINLGTEVDPNFINLGVRCSLNERKSFIGLFRKYRDVFSWTYDDLKMYDTGSFSMLYL